MFRRDGPGCGWKGCVSKIGDEMTGREVNLRRRGRGAGESSNGTLLGMGEIVDSKKRGRNR